MISNERQVIGRYESWLLQNADSSTAAALTEFQRALQSGEIELPGTTPATPLVAGGVNYCPNSDFKYSKKAIETPGTLPSDTTDDNYQCYRWFRQQQGSDITEDAAHALKSSAHSLYAASEGADSNIPIWDRVNGFVIDGSTGTLWDTAVHLYNNDVTPGNFWYVSLALGAVDAALVPSDLEMYCGFWHKTASGQGWIKGGTLTLDYDVIGIKGTKQLKYILVGLTDGGVTVYSQVLDVNDAPNTFNTAASDAANETNFVRIEYGDLSLSGFIQFKIFRQDVAAGTVYQIADIRNTNNLVFDDFGHRVNMTVIAALPSPVVQLTEAKAVSPSLSVGAFGGSLLRYQFTIKVPDSYNWSETLPASQWFRFGFTRTTGVPRHIRLDQVFIGRSHNLWSDSPFDPINGVVPSTSQTGGVPVTGGSGDPPEPGSGTCIRPDTPVLRLNLENNLEWSPYRETRHGDVLKTDTLVNNIVRMHRYGKTQMMYFTYFANGSWLPSNGAHRLRVDEDGNTRSVRSLRVGDKVWGWNAGIPGYTEITKQEVRLYKEPQDVGTYTLIGERGEGDHFYVAGFSKNRSGVFNHNLKDDGFGGIV